MHCDGGIYSLHTAGIPQLLKEKKSPSHGIQKVNYIEFQLDKSGKYITPMSNVLSFPEPRGHMSHTRTK